MKVESCVLINVGLTQHILSYKSGQVLDNQVRKVSEIFIRHRP